MAKRGIAVAGTGIAPDTEVEGQEEIGVVLIHRDKNIACWASICAA